MKYNARKTRCPPEQKIKKKKNVEITIIKDE